MIDYDGYFGMTSAELQQLGLEYRRDGFVAVANVLSRAEVDALRSEIIAVGRGLRGPVRGAQLREGSSDEEVIGNILALHMPHKISPLIRQSMSHPRIVEIVRALVGPNLK